MVFKRKEFAPLESKFYPFNEDPFQKGFCVQESKQEVTKVVGLVKMIENSPNVFSSIKYHHMYLSGALSGTLDRQDTVNTVISQMSDI